MVARIFREWITSLILLPGAFILIFSCAGRPILPPIGNTISGTVRDGNGPVAGATVRIQATDNSTHTDKEGKFTIDRLIENFSVTISAWKEGYYCAKADGISPTDGEVHLVLREYQKADNPDYEWMPPAVSTGDESCMSCKAELTQHWLNNDAHARSSRNPRFLTMYNGTDVQGNHSPPTRYSFNKDYGMFPLLPDPEQPYYGPGYRLDFPDSFGNCATCHVPGPAVNDPFGTNPNETDGADAFGVHCDFCHKVAGVRLDTESDLPLPDRPGVLSLDVRRPFLDDPERYQLFFGPFDDDNVPEEDTYLPLIKESRYCAACHFGVFWGTLVYNSFGEWLESPYGDPETGKTCQDCHMPAPTVTENGLMTNVAPDRGGIERDPMTLSSHSFPGADDEELLNNAVSLTVNAQRTDSRRLDVEVTVTNDRTGHHVPTDSPLRHLILLIEARDDRGVPLLFLEGPTVPEWGGVGDPAAGYYADHPGKAFAKILSELWTDKAPTGAYWNQTVVISDNRLAAFQSDTTRYSFRAPEDGHLTLTATLLFRRAYRELADQKGWNDPDIVMERVTVNIP